MSDVLYLRPIVPATTLADARDAAKQASGCFNLHRVEWAQSFVSADGGRMLCWYKAPDAESVRLAMRQLGADMDGVWPGTVLGAGRGGSTALSRVNRVAEASPAAALKDAGAAERIAGTLRDNGVALLLGFLSANRSRLALLLEGGDADDLAPAFEAAGLALERLWPCAPLGPEPAAQTPGRPDARNLPKPGTTHDF